jgi:ankyrin repeat protein
MFDDLLDACRRNDFERVVSLVTADPTLLTRSTPDGATPLLMALYHGSGDVVTALKAREWPRTVWEAAALDDADRLTELLAAEPGLVDTYSPDGWTALHLAAFFGAGRTADLLLSRGANHRLISRNTVANTPLHAAVAAKRLALVDSLLSAGADPTIRCEGYTPLAIAEANAFEAGAERIRQALDRWGAA